MITSSPRRRGLVGGLLGAVMLLGLAACDIEFPEQEIIFRHNSSTNSLDMLFLCKGITIPRDGDEELRKGIDAVRRVLNGRREFMVVNWPLYANYDEYVKDAREVLAEAESKGLASLEPGELQNLRIAQMFLAVEGHVSVQKVGVFLDDQGRLCGYQHLRIQEVDEFLLFLNELIRMSVLDDLTRERLDDPFFDEETTRMWRDKASGPEPWFDLDGGRIVVDIPMSDAAGRALKEHFLHEMTEADEDDDWVVSVGAQLLTQTQEVRFDEKGMHITIGHPSGTIRFEPGNPHLEYSAVLLDALVLEGVMPDTSMTLERARTLLQ